MLLKNTGRARWPSSRVIWANDGVRGATAGTVRNSNLSSLLLLHAPMERSGAGGVLQPLQPTLHRPGVQNPQNMARKGQLQGLLHLLHEFDITAVFPFQELQPLAQQEEVVHVGVTVATHLHFGVLEAK